MNFAVARKIAARELRGGLSGFYIFLLCLALGVAAIAAVGSVRSAIQEGLESEASTLLGGDAEIQFTYRFANESERDWISANSLAMSEIVDFRSMVVFDGGDVLETALTQVKGIDDLYPLYGNVELSPAMDLTEALEVRNGLPGLIAQQALLDRLQVEPGDILRLGTQIFELRAAIIHEPDSGTAGFGLGPRIIVRTVDLADSGLLAEGTLFETKIRMQLPLDARLQRLKNQVKEQFDNNGVRWRDRRNSTPGVSRFVDRMSAFLVLVGLAGMAVGGVGVSSAVRAYLERKTETIATLKSLGAERSTIFAVYLLQIGALSLVGIVIGLLIGGGIPTLLAPMLAEQLPVPVRTGFYPAPLIEAGIYGILTALIFSIWPLARAVEISPAGLFRDISAGSRRLPRLQYIIVVAFLTGLLIYAAAAFSGTARLAYWSAFGIVLALAALWLAAQFTRWLAARLARTGLTKGRPALRLALGAIGGPGGETSS
ncbi:MAG: FtsX-like permease family protein, partial [Rhodobacteraceae bacterium]|nr:FtsX-like permease family protein [Paracoccaceae bacterium]